MHQAFDGTKKHEQPSDSCKRGDEHSTLVKRKQILEGAEAIFLSRGFEGASMSKIASLSGVSKGTLYNHFENKAALFGAVIESVVHRDLTTRFCDREAGAGTCHATFTKLAEDLIRTLIAPSSLGLYRIIVSEAPRFPDLVDVLWRYGFQRILALITQNIAYWDAKGKLKTPNQALAAEQFLALCQTRLIHRKRFELPVDCSEESIKNVAHLSGSSFCKIYAP